MNIGNMPRFVTRLNSLIFVGVFMMLATVAVVPFYSAHSSSVPTAGEPAKVGDVNALKASNSTTLARGSSTFSLPLPEPPSETIATYASDCTTSQTNFVVGETVCVKVSGVPLSPFFPRRLTWATTDSTIVRSTDITADPQTDSLLITPTTVINGQTIDNRGTWQVVVRNPFFFYPEAEARFTVTNPASPSADLAVDSTRTPNSVPAGSQAIFGMQVTNYGPDSSTNVTLTDAVPANATFVSFVQTSGPAFTCTNTSGTTTCTIATLASGDIATFLATYDIDSGVAAGTEITNTADVASVTSVTPPVPATDDPNTRNNSTSATTTVTAASGGSTCTVTCPGNITTPADTTENGQPGAVVHFDPPTSEGTSCGAITVDHCNDCFFPVGTTVVSATEDGTTGASCSFTVTVTSGAAPTIICPTNKTATADSNCQATVDPGSPTTTGDNVTVTSSRSDGLPLTDPYPAGTTTITWTASNSSGTATCQQTVTVNDTTPPTITCPANITTGDDAGQCSATVDPGTATASDNCGTPTVTGTRSDGQPLNAPYPTGTTTITWTATDSSDNSSSCTQTVTVNDTENPTITCPANITTGNDAGQCSATVNPGTAAATDNCGAPTVTGTRSDGQALNAPYPKGTTTITWTATDGSGNHSSCTQTITVNDTEAPVITCPSNITRSTDPGTCSATINLSASATDNCDSNPTVTGVRSDAQPLTAPYPKGTTVVTWTATDSSGNTATPCAQTITVNDTEAPVISCPANITHGTDPGTCSAVINPGTATATDNCDNPTITGTRSDNQPLNAPYPRGTTTITWTARDSSGNTSSCTQTVTVNDTEAPVITCPANITRPNDPGTCSANINPGTATATDNCDTPTVTGARSDGGPLNGSYPVGTTTITWTATDGSGNHSSCTQTITVNDTEPPQISCPASFTLEPTCPSGAVGNYTTPVGTDNCPGAVTTRTAGGASGSVFPIGTTTVTYTVNDAHGNSASCSFTVTVKTVTQTIENLKTSVNNSSLSPTAKGGLIGKLQAAEDALAAGHTSTACQKLADFINSVQNLISHGDISATVGNAWISTAAHVRNTIGCTNNPCS